MFRRNVMYGDKNIGNNLLFRVDGRIPRMRNIQILL